MNHTHTIAVLMLALLALPVAAALPAQAAQQAHQHANTHADAAPVNDAPDVNTAGDSDLPDADADASEDDESDVNETDDGADADSDADDAMMGPPTDMPDPVPAHITEIHQLIRDFLNGELDRLGSAISRITPGNGR